MYAAELNATHLKRDVMVQGVVYKKVWSIESIWVTSSDTFYVVIYANERSSVNNRSTVRVPLDEIVEVMEED